MKWAGAFDKTALNYGETLAEISDRTQRIVFSHNLNGDRVRIRFSNRYSSHPLVMERVTIGIVRGEKTESITQITREGSGKIYLAPGEECYSDAAELAVAQKDRLAVFCYVKEKQRIGSVCAVWSRSMAEVSNSLRGDHTDGSDYEETDQREIYDLVRNEPEATRGMFFYGISGVQIRTGDEVKTIAAFGDSVTHMSYVTDALQQRLIDEYPGQITLINRGIGGNRLLHDATFVDTLPGKGSCFGMAGIRRFEQDVFGKEQVDSVLVLEGINDIMHPVQFCLPEDTVDAAALAEGYRLLAAAAHRHGAAIFGATITPCGNRNYPDAWNDMFDRGRREINALIRQGGIFDGYIDYDKAVRDEKFPSYMKKEYHLGDGLHPNAAGGAAMAAAIDLRALLSAGR